MIKQSKLSKICWVFVYLFPLIFGFAYLWLTTTPVDGFAYFFGDIFEFDIPYLNIEFFSAPPLSGLIGANAIILDRYLGYLVLVSLFRIVWKVFAYLPDVIGKLIDRWSL